MLSMGFVTLKNPELRVKTENFRARYLRLDRKIAAFFKDKWKKYPK